MCALIILGIECGYPASIKHGGYTLINNTVNYLSQVHYSCDEGYEMTGKNYGVDQFDSLKLCVLCSKETLRTFYINLKKIIYKIILQL